MIRGKLLLPDLEVKFVEESGLQNIEGELINSLVALSEISCSVAKDKNKEEKAIDIFADLVSVIYKLPMLMSYTPHTGLSTPFEYFFTYVIARHFSEFNFSDIKDLLVKLEEHRDEYKQLFTYITTFKEIYEKLLYTPADARPGYNFTSLVSYLQLTSILVWLLQPNLPDLNYLRIAALLNDLGKLFNPTDPVKEAIDILNKVTERSSCLKPVLNRVKELLEKTDDYFYRVIDKASRGASASDRLKDIIVNALDIAGIEKCKDDCYSLPVETEECNKCLEKLGKDIEETRKIYESVSQRLYKSILESIHDDIEGIKAVITKWDSIPSKKININPSVKGKNLGYIVFIDFPGVQRFIISFPKLRDMSFASFLVDFTTSVYSFVILDQEYYKRSGGNVRIPAEALLSGYGGHSYIVIRGDLMTKEEVKDLLINSSPKELDIKLDVRVADFAYEDSDKVYVRNYKEIWDETSSMNYERYLVDYNEKVYSLGLHRVCDSCGIRPAETIKDNEYLCGVCGLVRDLSRSRGFDAKLKSTYYVEGDTVTPFNDIKIEKVEGDKIGEYAIEAIAGYRKVDDTKYVAFVKADGNDAGKIFGYTATFSEYIDKSFRLDYGVKKRFYDTLHELMNAEKGVSITKDLTSRVLVGVLYLGGDDIMLMMPSVIAVPFAVRMFEGINMETGFTFKVGVISVKPDHPVQFAYKAVNELMESSKLDGKSSLGCLVFTSTLATHGVVKAELDKYKGKQDNKHNKVTESKENKQDQNSYLVVSNDVKNVKGLLQKVKLWPEENTSKTENVFKEFIEIYYNDNKENDNKEKVKERVRDIIRPLEDLTNYADTHNFYDTLAYILRYRARSKEREEDDKVRKGFTDHDLVSFILANRYTKKNEKEDKKENASMLIPLYDYYFILKSIRVGV